MVENLKEQPCIWRRGVGIWVDNVKVSGGVEKIFWVFVKQNKDKTKWGFTWVYDKNKTIDFRSQDRSPEPQH